MSDDVSRIHTLICATVRNRSCFENKSKAAQMIEEYMRGRFVTPSDVDHSAFSRKLNGSRAWTVGDALAIDSITGGTRIADAMVRANRPDAGDDASMIAALQQIAASIEDVARALPEMEHEDAAAVVNALIDIQQTAADALRAVTSRKVVSLAEDMRRFCK